MLVRAVGQELLGAYVGPNVDDIIRTVGNPQLDGTCITEDGQTVYIF
jgi:hypothetical protein